MYILYLTAKTSCGIYSIIILLYTAAIAFICPKLMRKDKYAVAVILCVLPVISAAIHFAINGKITFWAYKYLYLESVMPLVIAIPGKKKVLLSVKSIVSTLATLGTCAYFLLFSTSSPMVHNYTRYDYTESFRKMLNTLEDEYCLNSWKKIDYDSLLEEYLPKVEEAEKNNDEAAYAAVLNEVTYRFYDSHVYTDVSSTDIDIKARELLAGNDYGLSMIKTDDGKVIAVHVESEDGFIYDAPSNLNKLGIHNGTEIISWDGQDINDAINDAECIFPGLQFPVKSNEDVFRPLFLAGKGGENVEITFIDDNGNKKSARLKKLGTYDDRLMCSLISLLHTNNDYPNYYYKMIDDKCGYLHINDESFDMLSDNIAVARKGYYPKLVNYYADIIEGLKAQGMEYLVVDIRK